MSKKPLKITTDFIEVKINRDTGLLSMQGSVFIGLIVLFIASDSKPVHTLCIVFLVMDVIFFLAGFLANLKVSEEDDSSIEVDEDVTQDASAEPAVIVEHEQSESSVKQKKDVIRNKVQVPTQQDTVVEEEVHVQSDKKGGDSLAGKSQEEINAFWDAAFASGEDEE